MNPSLTARQLAFIRRPFCRPPTSEELDFLFGTAQQDVNPPEPARGV